jgi:lysophospholipase L1-like esterase
MPYDDISQDGFSTGGGYEPVLNDFLSISAGYSNIIKNEGIIGETSFDGLTRLPTVLSRHPDAEFYLVMFGMNDARPSLPVPSGLGLTLDDEDYNGTYKDNMQQIIDLIHSAGAEVSLAKIPIALADTYSDENLYEDPDQGARSVLIKEYNMVIDELVSNPLNRIAVTPPDFYSYFRDHYEDEYSDNIHPNGLGYRSIARLWMCCRSK